MSGGGAFFGRDLDDLEECKSEGEDDEECIENEGSSRRRKGSAQMLREGVSVKPPTLAYG